MQMAIPFLSPITGPWMSIVQSGSSNTLSGSSYFDKGEEIVAVRAVASDGSDTGTGVSSGLIVANTLPTAPSVSISPSSPIADQDDLVCTISSQSSDADNDGITYSFAWTVDGAS